MCQHGAIGMAREGHAFDSILKHYYRGSTLKTAGDQRRRFRGKPLGVPEVTLFVLPNARWYKCASHAENLRPQFWMLIRNILLLDRLCRTKSMGSSI